MKHSNIFYTFEYNTKEKRKSFLPQQKARAFTNNYGLDLFVCNDKISEGKTGFKLCEKMSLELFDKFIENHSGVENINNMIEEQIKRDGLSPRYTRPDEKKTDLFPKSEKDKTILNNAKLMKLLFVNGNFNRAGKKIRAKYIKTLCCDGAEYPMWVSSGKNENDCPRNADDTHYLMIQAGDYLVPCGCTEFNLIQRSGYQHLSKEWYGSQKEREKFYNNIREGKTYEESSELINEQIAKEESFILECGKKYEVQAKYLKTTFVDNAINSYLDARDNEGEYLSFQGAAFIGDLEKCSEISITLREKKKKESDIRRAELEAEQKIKQEEQNAIEQEKLKEVENAFINGGTIKDGKLIVEIADRYKINIPIRTRGWILNSLSECTMTEDGSMSYRYWKTKGAKGSQTVYKILFDIRKALQTLTSA